MAYHFLSGTNFDFEAIARRAAADRGPRHSLYQMAEHLGGTIHQPQDYAVVPLDRWLARFHGRPEHWAMARHLASRLSPQDVVYATGEDVGLTMAVYLSFKPKAQRPTLASYCMVPRRLRNRICLHVLGLKRTIDLLTVHDPDNVALLQQQFHLPPEKIFQILPQVDELFFTPGPATDLRGDRPLLVSAGLEQRDYLTVAQAVAGQAVEAKICAFSPNALPKTRTRMPEATPDNMIMRYFEFAELRDLYRSADVVVISTLKNSYAGLTVLIEAMACHRPVVITHNEGLATEVIDRGLALGFAAGDAQDLWRRVDYLLNHPDEAQTMADRAYEYFRTHHTSQQYIDGLLARLQEVALAPVGA